MTLGDLYRVPVVAIAKRLNAERFGGRIPLARVFIRWNPNLKALAGRCQGSGGRCLPRFWEIDLSIDYHLAHDEAQVEATLAHELLHVLVGHKHGTEWKREAAAMGIERYCKPEGIAERSVRYIYRCPQCGTEFPRANRYRRAMQCARCKVPIELEEEKRK